MTSGVNQALPPVLASQTGADGKAVRIRMPQGDFAEALGIGMPSKQLNSGNARADRQNIEAKSLWQRLAEKLEIATGRSPEVAAEPDTTSSSESPRLKATADHRAVGKHHDDKAGERRQEGGDLDGLPAAHQVAETTRPVAIQVVSPTRAAVFPASARAIGQAETEPLSNVVRAREEALVPLDRTTSESTMANSSLPAEPVRKQDSAAPFFMSLGRGEPAASVRFEPAAVPTAGSAEPSPAARTRAKDALAETPAEPAKVAPRITIVAQQSIPAPTPSTALVLVESIATSDLLEPARTSALDAIPASAAHASVRSLKIQLHPAELGMVTATLRFAGEQLSIELQVETHDAYRHLSSDGDAIMKSLRDLGYDVDRVTILQPGPAATSAGLPDNGAPTQSGQGRTFEQSGSGAAGDGNGGSSGRQPGEDGSSSRSGWHNAAAQREQKSSGLYI